MQVGILRGHIIMSQNVARPEACLKQNRIESELLSEFI